MSKPTAPQLITDRRRAKRQSSIKLRLATWELINELRTNFNTLGVRVQALEERTTALEYHCQVEPPEPLGYCQCPEPKPNEPMPGLAETLAPNEVVQENSLHRALRCVYESMAEQCCATCGLEIKPE